MLVKLLIFVFSFLIFHQLFFKNTLTETAKNMKSSEKKKLNDACKQKINDEKMKCDQKMSQLKMQSNRDIQTKNNELEKQKSELQKQKSECDKKISELERQIQTDTDDVEVDDEIKVDLFANIELE